MTVRTRGDEGRPDRGPGAGGGGRADRRAWLALGLGVVGVAAVAWAVLGLHEPVGLNFRAAERITYYRELSLLLGLGVAAGLAAIMAARGARPHWLRLVARLAGVAGMLGGGLFLVTAVGLCGSSVLWGYCNP